MLVRLNVRRINTKVFVITANGLANTAKSVNDSVVKTLWKATILIHSAAPNKSDLACFVLQQQNSTVTGITRM